MRKLDVVVRIDDETQYIVFRRSLLWVHHFLVKQIEYDLGRLTYGDDE